ncbi:MAG: hypothetical protein QM289_01775 [Bacillota bacterium]|jgi:hypothetical protein|nr:hypothetical protein [Bacillota bacterium]NLM08173.1 hypothetical protein [Clostridiales Family XIII bacterium]HOA43295.1 hypothetical protein [Bacillota bacterium]HPZ60111.1 hypothetical protein [Bacillota bacterium]HQC82745.1 hypothetical protein [Bacillota bacterium]
MKKTAMALVLVIVMLCSTAFAAASDPDVAIVSPKETVSGNNLLVSVKLTAPKTIKVYVYEEKEKVGDTLVSIDPSKISEGNLSSKSLVSVSVIMPETFEGTGNLQFYNKQIDDVTPGLYRIKVEVLDKDNTVTATTTTRTVVMPKDSQADAGNKIFQSQQSGVLQWVQNLIKSIFRN